MALPVDVVAVTVGIGTEAIVAVNSVVVGVAPDRLRAWHRPVGLSVEIDGKPVDAAAATTLVVMNGQYLRGLDLSPRGHPGDGVAEAQLYALPPGARRAMRSRLAVGAHLPHPAITIRRAHRVDRPGFTPRRGGSRPHRPGEGHEPRVRPPPRRLPPPGMTGTAIPRLCDVSPGCRGSG